MDVHYVTNANARVKHVLYFFTFFPGIRISALPAAKWVPRRTAILCSINGGAIDAQPQDRVERDSAVTPG
jgi:hypothetical protein